MVRCFGPRWPLFGETLYSGTFAIMSLSLVFSIGQHLVVQFNSGSRIFRANPVIAGLVNLAALFCLFPQSTSPEYLRWFGVTGFFGSSSFDVELTAPPASLDKSHFIIPEKVMKIV
ncbi:hypothetical protein, partial [uncultured Desulfovibrio sp.]|mgnify:CR=1 FL=1|uniref:hypothetical protein n=1 Tax=uncultured Desulfovibrio sp. TaxID=167968 RepID=UPI0005524C37